MKNLSLFFLSIVFVAIVGEKANAGAGDSGAYDCWLSGPCKQIPIDLDMLISRKNAGALEFVVELYSPESGKDGLALLRDKTTGKIFKFVSSDPKATQISVDTYQEKGKTFLSIRPDLFVVLFQETYRADRTQRFSDTEVGGHVRLLTDYLKSGNWDIPISLDGRSTNREVITEEAFFSLSFHPRNI